MKRGVAMFYHMTVIIVFLTASSMIVKPVKKLITDKDIIQIDPRLTIISGGGGNSGLLVTDKAVVVIDTKMPSEAEGLYKMAKEKANGKNIIVINTHYHMDHTGGNNLYKGDKIYIGSYDKSFLNSQIKLQDMPTDYVKDKLELPMGDETIEMYNVGQAHTFDDVIVYLKNRKLMFTGDLVFNHINPVLKKESGADVDKWIAALKSLLSNWYVKTYVPGHGNKGDKAIINDMIAYFEDMKTAASDKGKENEIREKYSAWYVMPSMASPEITIDYIRKSKIQE